MRNAVNTTPLFLALFGDDPTEPMDVALETVLENRTRIAADLRGTIERAVRSHAHLPGFRDPFKATPQLLLEGARRAVSRDPYLPTTILVAWQALRAPLAASLDRYIAERPMPAPPGDAEAEPLWAEAVRDYMAEAVRAHPDEREAEVRVLLWMRVPGPGSLAIGPDAVVLDECADEAGGNEGGANDNLLSPVWTRLLDDLAATDSESEVWAEADEAMARVAVLVEQKDAERAERSSARAQREAAEQEAAAERALLSEDLALLDTCCADELTLQELPAASALSADCCPATELARARELVGRLSELLAEHTALREAPPLAKAELRAWRACCEASEDAIASLHAEISALLGEGARPEGGSDTDTEPAHAITSPSDGGEHDERGSAADESDAEGELESDEAIPVPDEHDIVDDSAPVETPVVDADAPVEIAPSGVTPDAPAAAADETLDEMPDEAPTTDAPTVVTGATIAARVPASGPMSAATVATEAEDDVEEDAEEEPSDVSPLLMDLVAEDDFAGAYWLARAERARDGMPDPALFAASVASVRVTGDADALAPALLEIARNYVLSDRVRWQLLEFAASLGPALVAPGTGLVVWLRAPNALPALRPLAKAVGDFAAHNIPIAAEGLAAAAGEGACTREIESASEAAREWMTTAPNRKLLYANHIWRKLVAHGSGQLATLVAVAAEDRRDRVSSARASLDEWLDESRVDDRVQTMQRARAGGRTSSVTGPARSQIVRDCLAAARLVDAWCLAVERARAMETGRGWAETAMRELQSSVAKAAPDTLAALARLDGPRGAAARAAERAIARLLALLAIEPTSAPEHEPWPGRLDALLTERLWMLPEVAVDDDGTPTEAGLAAIPEALAAARSEHRSIDRACLMWIERGDFRFLEGLAARREGEQTAEVQRQCREALDAACARLARLADQTIADVEQAVLDGIIGVDTDSASRASGDRIRPTEGDAVRSEYHSVIERVRTSTNLNFPRLRAELDEVRERVENARRDRVDHLREIWQDLAPRLGGLAEASQVDELNRFVDDAFARGDTRVLDECLAHVKESVERGVLAEDGWLVGSHKRLPLEHFLKTAPLIEEQLKAGLSRVTDGIRRGEQLWASFGKRSAKRREEAHAAVSAWADLKRRGPQHDRASDFVGKILTFLGYTPVDGDGRWLSVERSTPDVLHLRARMSASTLARPIPQFGSKGQPLFDVLCVWERPGADVISARVHEAHLDARPVILLYLGRLYERQRAEVLRVSREHGLAVAVLDELLLLFLTAEKDARLGAFLACALPFTAVNPYVPFHVGDVPSEIFYGREAFAREITSPTGTCLVYGGRQLGKSALLSHCQRQFHKPERRQFAWMKEVKILFDPLHGKTTTNVLTWMRDRLAEAGLVPPNLKSERADRIEAQIAAAFATDPELRVLFLLDEADTFLDADAKDNFAVVSTIKNLMFETKGRLKAVFAGLHNVQRFQGIRNQPLVQFGLPLCVGPLEPKAAEALVREPFETLGFRFPNASALLRILSYTNYHAGLIQLFAQELLRRLRAKSGRGVPPVSIEPADIDAVYRQVRGAIKERFDITVRLDRRYELIACAMIYDQMHVRDSFARPYTGADLLDLSRLWWESAFATVASDQMHGLLDEMCGLGVLVRTEEGTYRLRSPNLVRLMGTERDIATRLEELSRLTPDVEFDADSHHALVDDETRTYSPLTYAQERGLTMQQWSVAAIFGSEALGYGQLEAALRSFGVEGNERDASVFAVIPEDLAAPDDLVDWLRQFTRSTRDSARRVVCQHVKAEDRRVAERIRKALKWARSRPRGQSQSLLIAFLFDAAATWSWIARDHALSEPLEEQLASATFCRKWTANGLRQRLDRSKMLETEEVCRATLEATGGWPYLLERVIAETKRDDPRPMARRLVAEFAEPGPRRDAFLAATGLAVAGSARLVLDFIHQEFSGPAERELIAPEFLPALDSRECVTTLAYLERLGIVDAAGTTVAIDPVVRRALYG